VIAALFHDAICSTGCRRRFRPINFHGRR
jgi:hypothetical protein